MSKRTDAVAALRRMTEAEIAQHLDEQRRRLFDVRFQQVTGQVENVRQLRQVRREMARTLTVRAEMAALGGEAGSGEGAQPVEADVGGEPTESDNEGDDDE